MQKVSIVVPCWNVEAYLDRCVESLIHQTLQDIEIILVDDGSQDNCSKMCDEWAIRDARIKVIHKENAGLGMACNSGIEASSGEYIAFCDSDDWVDADMYAAMYEAAVKYQAQMVFTGIRRVDENGNATPMAQATELKVYSDKSEIYQFALGMIASEPSVRKERQVEMSAKVVLYDNRLLKNWNIRFESERCLMSEDLFFNWDNLMHASTVVELPQTFYNYFVNTRSLSSAIRTDRFEKTLRLRDELFSRYKNVDEQFRFRVNRLFVGYVRRYMMQICNETSIAFMKKRRLLATIVNHPIWKEITAEYPIQRMPKTHKLFLDATLLKSPFLIIMLSKLKSSFRVTNR